MDAVTHMHNARIIQVPGKEDEQAQPFQLLWEDDQGETHVGGESADPAELADLLKRKREAEADAEP